jgi:predicted component of type VI protein secretion system
MDDQPILGVGGVAGVPSRRQGGYRGRKRKPEPGQGDDDQTPVPPLPGAAPAQGASGQDDPASSLVEALDRLRATEAPQAAEVELARHLRGARYYQEESRHGLPVVGEPPSAPPEAPGAPG